jgi:hypothetical protein
MANNFMGGLQGLIKGYNPSLPDSTAKAISQSGMVQQSTYLNNLNYNERDVRKNNQKGTKCPP